MRGGDAAPKGWHGLADRPPSARGSGVPVTGHPSLARRRRFPAPRGGDHLERQKTTGVLRRFRGETMGVTTGVGMGMPRPDGEVMSVCGAASPLSSGIVGRRLTPAACGCARAAASCGASGAGGCRCAARRLGAGECGGRVDRRGEAPPRFPAATIDAAAFGGGGPTPGREWTGGGVGRGSIRSWRGMTPVGRRRR